jgi:hypothetical protein
MEVLKQHLGCESSAFTVMSRQKETATDKSRLVGVRACTHSALKPTKAHPVISGASIYE